MLMLELTGLKILLLDDDAFSRKLVSRMLGDLGCTQIAQAADGKLGFEMLTASLECPDLALVDLEMPGISGFGFIKLVRESPDSPNSDLPIVVLTGHGEREMVVKAAKLSIQGYLLKPISNNVLAKKIRSVLRND